MVSALPCGIKRTNYIVSELNGTSTRLPHCVATTETWVMKSISHFTRQRRVLTSYISESKVPFAARRLTDLLTHPSDRTQSTEKALRSYSLAPRLLFIFDRQKFLVKIYDDQASKTG